MIRAVLTIDDVASKNTPAIVDYLKGKGIQAVMFAVGCKIEQYPEQAAYAVKNGMILGNHSYSHPAFSKLSIEKCMKEIDQCENALAKLYQSAGIERRIRPFRFPYGDKGGMNKAALQRYLSEKGFNKLKDTQIPYQWWKENSLDKDIDTFWTFDFEEYMIRPGSAFTKEDVWRKMHDPNPGLGAPLFAENGHHIILLHAHDETEELMPGYYQLLIDHLLENGVTFDVPEFF